MMDIILWIILIAFVYSKLTLLYYLFGKSGLFCFNITMSILSNLIILKKVIIFEQQISLSGITFLAILCSLNLITEKYNDKSAIKSIILNMIIHITFVIMIHFTLYFQQNEFDTSNIHLKVLFYNASYISIIFTGTYIIFLCNYVNIKIYSTLQKNNINSKWFKHNVSRLCSSCIAYILANISMYVIAQLYPENNINIVQSSSIFTIAIMIIDTFIYYFLNKIKIKDIHVSQ
ncbi:queuosine precursor transporter [Borrelia persica]|uniref:queuosine precursor transporter n=1 Tax=Borrelia persica TaxID=44448 RepID=UPI0009FE9193|nr:queuosine precursor transporter [Borrelia persica]